MGKGKVTSESWDHGISGSWINQDATDAFTWAAATVAGSKTKDINMEPNFTGTVLEVSRFDDQFKRYELVKSISAKHQSLYS